MRHHLPQKVLHSKGGSHKDTLLCTPLLWDTPYQPANLNPVIRHVAPTHTLNFSSNSLCHVVCPTDHTADPALRTTGVDRVGHCTVFTEVGPTTVAAWSVAGFALPALGAKSSKGRCTGINRGRKSTVAYNT